MAAKKPAPAKKPDYPKMEFEDASAFDRWLAKEHAKATGVWVIFAKKSSGITSVDYKGALEVAMTWGWIDGQAGSVDADRWMQKYTPRGPRSIWSKINRERIASLEAAGRMKPPGRAAVEAAKADGRWDRAYDSPSNAKVPEDLAKALAKNARAKKMFATLDSINRYAILHRVQTAKKPETRTKRITTFVDMLARGETIHPPRTKKPPPKRR